MDRIIEHRAIQYLTTTRTWAYVDGDGGSDSILMLEHEYKIGLPLGWSNDQWTDRNRASYRDSSIRENLPNISSASVSAIIAC